MRTRRRHFAPLAALALLVTLAPGPARWAPFFARGERE